MISADLSNAYSEVMLDDLELAIEHLGTVTGLDAWKIELLISFARLILQNNYIECSKGLYKLKECLPMGMSASPICLDIVGLSSEVKRISINNSLPQDLPLQMYELLNDDEISLEGNLRSYMRYQDDTKAIAYSQKQTNIKFIILNIGTMFPSHIPINLDCFHLYGSFLDVTFLRSISSNRFTTMVKKKFTSPPTVLNPKSMTPPKLKNCSLYSELLRIRRICSKEKIINLYDSLLLREFKSRGYSNVETKIQLALNKINRNFDSSFKRLEKEVNTSKLVYGSTSVFDKFSNSHQVVRRILKKSLGDQDVRLPLLIPAKKLKSYLHTKRRYLAKLRSFNTTN